MIGRVDQEGRSLLTVQLKHPTSSTEFDLDVWIDTGFTGDLVVPSSMLSMMSLPPGTAISGVLADGSQVTFSTITCILDWFGLTTQIEIIANQGEHPLLGVGLLLDRDLRVDFRNKIVRLD